MLYDDDDDDDDDEYDFLWRRNAMHKITRSPWEKKTHHKSELQFLKIVSWAWT